MSNDDSNGETFEIIDRRMENSTLNVNDKTESLSSISSAASLLPSPGVSLTSVPTSSTSGNLLSNVTPPSVLPSFITVPPIPTSQLPPSTQPFIPPLAQQPSFSTGVIDPPNLVTEQPMNPTQFSAAIPPSKGVQHGPTRSYTPEIPVATPDSGEGIFDWVKGAVSSNKLLMTFVEKAKSSVDSMITTLDPQMKELYMNSGGDVMIFVASNDDSKISPVRAAFQTVFGKATVSGIKAESTNSAIQPVGFPAGIAAAQEKLQAVFKLPSVAPVPVVAIENFLVEIEQDKWYDAGVLTLNDPLRQINLQTFTQFTPVPSSLITVLQLDTPENYPQKSSGYALTIDSLMSKQQTGTTGADFEWHLAVAGVSKRDLYFLAAKSLASLYKSEIYKQEPSAIGNTSFV